MGASACRFRKGAGCRSERLSTWRTRYLGGFERFASHPTTGRFRLDVDAVKVCWNPGEVDCQSEVLKCDSRTARESLDHTASGDKIADLVVQWTRCEAKRVNLAVVECKNSTREELIAGAYAQVKQTQDRLKTYLAEKGADAVDFLGYVVAPKGARPPRRAPTRVNLIHFAGPAFSTDLRASM